MKNKYFAKLLHNHPNDTDPSINLPELSHFERETNTSEGCEYLDDNIRMKEQPYHNTKTSEEWKSTIYLLII